MYYNRGNELGKVKLECHVSENTQRSIKPKDSQSHSHLPIMTRIIIANANELLGGQNT